MSETTARNMQEAQAALAQVEKVTAVVLPEPSTALVTVQDADPPTAEEIRRRMNEIDMSDTNSIISFGSSAQAELQEISQSMLQGVRNKDVGPAGDSLRDIVTRSAASRSASSTCAGNCRGGETAGPRRAGGEIRREVRGVQGQIDRITDDLLKHEQCTPEGHREPRHALRQDPRLL